MEFIFGLIVLALDIWAVINIIGSSASGGAKILWTLLIIILPIVGFIIWFFAGPRSRSARA
jgi:Phospholipase_D-nuclease N-terminal